MKIYIRIFWTTCIAMLLASCLEDTGYLDIQNGVNKDIPVISIGQDQYGLNVKTIEIASAPTPIAVVISAARLTKDSEVTLAVSPEALDIYNAEQAALHDDFVPFELLPANLYEIPSLKITIPANKLDTDFTFNVFSAGIDLSKNYALPLVITDATGAVVASNLNTSIVGIIVKNRFDGHYSVTGTMVDAANATLTGAYPWDVYLVTNGANQVIVYDNDYAHDFYHKILSAGAANVYGAFGVVFNFDANNKVTSVVNLYGQPSSNGRSAELDPSGVNTWDPATKTLRVKYWMNQPSVIAGHRTSFDETFTYKGPRP